LYYITEGLYSADRRRKQAARAQETEEQKVANSRRMRAARAQETEEQKVADKKRKQAARAQEAAGQAWPDGVTPCRVHTYGVDAQESCMGCRNWCDEMDRRTAAAVALPPPPLPTGVWRPTPPLGREQPADASRSTAAMRWRRPQRLYSRRGAQPR